MNKIHIPTKPERGTDLLHLRMPAKLVARFKACEKTHPQLDLRGVILDYIIKLIQQLEGESQNGRHSTGA